jgi:ATP synthase F1 gamma subunit
MSIKNVNDIIEEGNALKDIAQSYSEVASIKLKRIRSEVEKTRNFYDELTEVYGLINKIAAIKKVTPPLKTEGSVAILLTSNYRFHGNINRQLIHYFLANTAKLNCDKIVIGKTGQQFLKSIRYFHKFSGINFKADLPTAEELKNLVEKINSYEQVLVFYSQFKSVMVQIPIVKDITQSHPALITKEVDHKLAADFIFEPDILKMLHFFDSQIKILLLEQTILESELARTASRLISMDQAQSHAKDFVKDQKKLLFQAQKTTQNSKLLEMLSFKHKAKKGQLSSNL